MYKVKYNKNITHDHLSVNPCLDPSSLSQEVNSNGHPVTTRLFVVFWRKQKSTHGATPDFYTANLHYKNASSDLRSGGRVMGGIFRVLSGDGVLILLGNRVPHLSFLCPGRGSIFFVWSKRPFLLHHAQWLSMNAFWIRTSTTYSSITCCVWMWAPLTNRIEPKALSNQGTARLVWTSFTQICRDSFHLNPQNSFRDLIMFSVNPFSSTCLREQRFALENYSETVFIAFVCEQPQLCSGGFVIPWDLIRPGYPGCFFSLSPYFSRLEAGTFPVIHIRPAHKIHLQK